MYGHRYQLEREDKQRQPNTEEAVKEPVRKKPRTLKEYESYRYVLPSTTVINAYKHLKAMSQEIDAANALMQKDVHTKVTLHYDTTSRSRIPGEWPCLITIF